MTKEEKAKAYDEALEKAKQTLEKSSSEYTAKTVVYYFFPELAESKSKDEMIRKSIVSIINQYARMCEKEGDPCEASLINDALAYLEKQKEQKSAEWDELQAEFRSINEAFEDGKKEVVAHPEKYGLCHKTEWGDGEMKALDSIIDDYELAAKSFCGHDGKIMFLKAIRDGEYGLSKQEWSEEDESFLDSIEEAIHSYYDLNHAPQYDYWLEKKLNRPIL